MAIQQPDHELLVEALAGAPLISEGEGENILKVKLQGVGEGSPCGVHVQGRVSRFGFYHDSPRLENDATDVTLEFSPLPAGSVVIGRNSGTNLAGLSGSITSNLIMIDHTPPEHPVVTGCTPGGSYGPNGRTTEGDTLTFYQNTRDGLVSDGAISCPPSSNLSAISC